jgi:hypothetical protein
MARVARLKTTTGQTMAIAQQNEYRYFLTDLLSNQIISEVPFKSVSFERTNRRAGSFSGTIPYIASTDGLNLYEATMPGRTGIYVMRNGVCVWGGIVWSRSYSLESRELGVEGGEFLSYFYHRNIWQTLQYGSEFIGVSEYSNNGGTATVATEVPHGFRVGSVIRVTFTSPLVDGTHTITAVPSATQFQFETTFADGSGASTSGACRLLIDSYDLARDLVYRVSSDLGGLAFANEFIKPAKEFQASITTKLRSANIVTLRTQESHNIIPGQEIEVFEIDADIDGFHIVTEVPDNQTIKFQQFGSDIERSSLPGTRVLNVVTKELLNNLATITVDQPHNASIGQTIFLSGVDSFFTGVLDQTFNGRFVITGIPSATSFSFSSGGILNVPETSVAGGLARFGSRVVYGDYGSFTSNSEIGIDFENFEKSGYYQDTQVYRGFEQRTIGEILEEYSNTVEGGFEYRIDCDYDYDTASFTRTFRMFPVDLAEPPPPGDVYPVTAFGAEKVVFEYPGNIESFSIEETAEDAATRFFVVGNIEDLNNEASQPYAGASSSYLLDNKNGRSWPLLDQSEQLDKIENELTLHEYARDYLYESLPPISTYSLTVNGSLDPVVGSFFPGDWCSIIINDSFVQQRLASDQEPRDDVIIRKISSYKVKVPDSPSFPEMVDLEIITDWKVDQIGN